MTTNAFRPDSDGADLAHFVQQGFVVYRGIHGSLHIDACRGYILDHFQKLQRLSREKGQFAEDVNGWCVAIMAEFARTELYQRLIHNPSLGAMAQKYVGPDVAWFNYEGLFINVPKDKDPVTLKGQHTDVWTGTGMNTVFAATFFTDNDEYNGLSVCPGSHLQGLMPVYNRKIDPAFDPKFNQINLMCRAGDIVVWHPLLIHATTGHSDKNIRISMTSRFTSTETAKTSQERALGYTTLSVGPMNQVLRLVGNDLLLPFRTMGGYVGVDRNMAGIYRHSPFKDAPDYSQYLR